MEPIRALMIVEMIGRPREHLEETLKEYTKKISSEKGITLINEKIHEPKKIEHKKDEKEATEDKKETKIESELFSTFAEIEIESKDITTLMRIIFSYLPSHIEIISPEHLELKNIDFNDLFNEVIRKMHEYDSIAKSMIMENKIMKEKFRQILSNLQKPVIKVKEKKDTVKEEEKEIETSKNISSLGKEEKIEEVKIEEKVNAKPKKSRNKK